MFAVVVALALLATSANSFAQQMVPTEVTVQATGAGWYLTDASGMTLYTYDRDTAAGKSQCDDEDEKRVLGPNNTADGAKFDACIKTWPPLAAPMDAKPVGDWSINIRNNNSKQWVYKGKPLYTYVKDTQPGAMIGEGVGNAWHVAFRPIATPAEITVRGTLLGRVLADSKGLTLYTYGGDITAAKSACNNRCLEKWRPLSAPLMANPSGDWSVIVRDDGSKQWAHRGRPLYTYNMELAPGGTKGDGVDQVWQVAVVEPPPTRPSWVKVSPSDIGPVLTDAKGMTLYTAPTVGAWSFDVLKKSACRGDCLRANWRPLLLASTEPKPMGNWSTVTHEDGTAQLTYMGDPVYTFVGDSKPGDVVQGENFGNGQYQASAGFRAIRESSQVRE